MNHHVRTLSPFALKVWIEDWEHEEKDWRVVCSAKVLNGPQGFLIETLDTPVKYRRKGYATALVQKLVEIAQKKGCRCEPICIEKTPEAIGFWNAMGMKDGLGEEDL